MFKKIIAGVLLAVFISFTASPLLYAKEIRFGTAVPLKSLQYISSENSYEGENVKFEVLEDVLNDEGITVVKQGAIVNGAITLITPASNCGTTGKIEVRFYSIKQEGKTYTIDGTLVKKGKDRFDPDNEGQFFCNVFFGVLFWPWGLYEVCSKGKKTIIQENTSLIYKVDRRIIFEP